MKINIEETSLLTNYYYCCCYHCYVMQFLPRPDYNCHTLCILKWRIDDYRTDPVQFLIQIHGYECLHIPSVLPSNPKAKTLPPTTRLKILVLEPYWGGRNISNEIKRCSSILYRDVADIPPEAQVVKHCSMFMFTSIQDTATVCNVCHFVGDGIVCNLCKGSHHLCPL